MHNFISEDDIEQAILAKLRQAPFHYDIFFTKNAMKMESTLLSLMLMDF